MKPEDVYWNLRKKLYSIKNRRTGLVQMHSRGFALTDVEMIVQKAGYRRAQREGQRNVHSYLRGNVGIIRRDQKDLQEITYSPWIAPYWRPINEMTHIISADYVLGNIDENGKPHIWAENIRLHSLT